MKIYGQLDTTEMVLDLQKILQDIETAEENGCALVEVRYSYNPNFKVQHSMEYRALKTAILLLSMIHERNLDLTLRDILVKMADVENKTVFYGMKVDNNFEHFSDRLWRVDKEQIKKAFENIKNQMNPILSAITQIEHYLK